MTLPEAARYLHLTGGELAKLAARGDIPAHKVGGKWRFYRPELNDWLERRMATLSGHELVKVERQLSAGADSAAGEPLVSDLLSPFSVNLHFAARTKPSALRDLVDLAAASGLVLDPGAIRQAVVEREEMFSTAIGPGVAFPHPRRQMPEALTDSIVAFARAPSGIPFGAPDGSLTDLFFLVCSFEDHTHLRILARLARLVREASLLDDLRRLDEVTDSLQALRSRETAVFSPPSGTP